MKLISHRGNINGELKSRENEPIYIDEALDYGFDVEIDVWVIDNNLWLGHDEPQYMVNLNWFISRIDSLWLHCKNLDSLYFFSDCVHIFNYFWHQKDDFTLVSNGVIWTFPGKELTINSICVIPELHNITKNTLPNCLGVCSDFISKFK